MYRFGKSSESPAFKDAAHESAVIIPPCTYIFQRSNSAKKSCGEGRSSLYRSPKSVSCWAVIWLSWITDGTNPSSLLTLIGYHAHQVRYACRSGRKTKTASSLSFFNARSLRQLNNDQFRVNTQDLLSYLIDHNGHKNKTVATLSCLPRRRSEGFVARERTRDEPLTTSAWEATPWDANNERRIINNC